MEAPEQVVSALLPLLRNFCAGPCGIAFGGSHAKEAADAWSDVDVYLFAERVLPGARRAELVRQALGADSEAVSWGSDEPFVQGGTDFRRGGVPVEVWLRETGAVERALAECLAGRITRKPAVWAVMGFFGHAVMADVRAMRIIEDPVGVLARWKEQAAVYPEPLRRAILSRFTAEAGFWPGNLHYHTAVERADRIYAAGIVQQTVQALVQVAFALNREPFPGEKQLAAKLEKLPILPAAFAARIEALLYPGASPDAHRLRAQQRDLAALVGEIRSLVDNVEPAESFRVDA